MNINTIQEVLGTLEGLKKANIEHVDRTEVQYASVLKAIEESAKSRAPDQDHFPALPNVKPAEALPQNNAPNRRGWENEKLPVTDL